MVLAGWDGLATAQLLLAAVDSHDLDLLALSETKDGLNQCASYSGVMCVNKIFLLTVVLILP